MSPLPTLYVVALLSWAGSSSAQRAAAPPAPPSELRTYTRRLSELGFPDGLSLEGQSAERSIAFRLPGHSSVSGATLHLRARFSRAAMAQSNLQVFANGTRVATLLRSQADTAGAATVDITLPSSALAGDFVNITLRSAVAAVGDQCLDQRLGLGFVAVDAQSEFSYSSSLTAITTVRQAWAILPDTVSIALPGRALTGRELHAALEVSLAATGEGHIVRYVRLPTLGDITIAKRTEVGVLPQVAAAPPADRNLALLRYSSADGARLSIFVDADRGAATSLFRTPQLSALAGQAAMEVGAAQPDARAASSANDVTLAHLGVTDLARSVGAEATWRIPLDVRDLPAGRVPSRVDLQLVTAPNSGDRQLVLFAFYNGTLVRSADVNQSGSPQMIRIGLPSTLLTTRNELRIMLQRHLPGAATCTPLDAAIPAQILPASVVTTTAVDRKAGVFTAVSARLDAQSPLYLPADARDHPERYLPLIVPFGRAFWSPTRTPTPQFYGNEAPDSPSSTFVVLGRPPHTELDGPVAVTAGRFVAHRKNSADTLLAITDLSTWTVAQVVHWSGQLGVQIIPGAPRPRLPDWPGAYGASTVMLSDADSSMMQLNTVDADAEVLFNDGPTIGERIRKDLVLWSLFTLLLVLPLIILGVRAVVSRTPRRTLSRRLERSAPPAPQVPGP